MSKSIYSFWELICEFPIVIPRVQRDYAYGRVDDEKAKAVSGNILSSIHNVLVPDTLDSDSGIIPLAMDFVYGNVSEGVGLTPLDGQQRLTTLFLLHLYALIVKDSSIEDIVARQARRGDADWCKLKKFSYETRQSANDFCKSLIEDFKYELKSQKSLSQQILNNPKCLPSYSTDPTISSMLVIIDRIAELFSDISNLWEKLTEERRVYFYFLPMSEFGLSDDLYIKMNSRGKSLTNYELFKSDFLEFLENNHSDLKKSFSDNLDGKWTDILWKNAETASGGNKSVASVDNGFMNMFANVSLLFYHLRTDKNFSEDEYRNSDSKYLTQPFDKQFTSREEVDTLFDIFDKIESTLSGNNLNTYWKDTFYTSDNVLGDDSERIRLFWPQKENIFVLISRRKLTKAQLIVFYAIYLGIHNGLEITTLRRRLRHLRNLVANSENELRGQKLHGMLTETKEYITNGTFPTTLFFNTYQVQEEMDKEQMNEWDSLWKAENHNLLKGSIFLFMRKEATHLLQKFCALFNEKYIEATPNLRRAFLIAGKETDYMQYEIGMEKPNYKQRYFVCRHELWSTFFKWSHIRHNQESIIDCLEKLPSDCSLLENYLKEGLKSLSSKSWKYYLIKYPEDRKTNVPWSQGVYHWDDIDNKPLEVIMLNSSQHGQYNLEWNILNSTLRYEYSDHCSIDDHNHEKVKLELANSSLNGTQEGWEVYTYEPDYLLDELKTLTISSDGNESLKYSITDNLVHVPDGTDYITFGKSLIDDIESIYNAHHVPGVDDSEQSSESSVTE